MFWTIKRRYCLSNAVFLRVKIYIINAAAINIIDIQLKKLLVSRINVFMNVLIELVSVFVLIGLPIDRALGPLTSYMIETNHIIIVKI